jgi:hypothetical protein
VRCLRYNTEKLELIIFPHQHDDRFNSFHEFHIIRAVVGILCFFFFLRGTMFAWHNYHSSTHVLSEKVKEIVMLKRIFPAMIAVALLTSSPLTVSAQSFSPSSEPQSTCEPDAQTTDLSTSGHEVTVRVDSIDYQNGELVLATPRGIVEAVADPEEIQDLREGDLLTMCIDDEVWIGEQEPRTFI